ARAPQEAATGGSVPAKRRLHVPWRVEFTRDFGDRHRLLPRLGRPLNPGAVAARRLRLVRRRLQRRCDLPDCAPLVPGAAAYRDLEAGRMIALLLAAGLARVQAAGELRWAGDLQGGEPYGFRDPRDPSRLGGVAGGLGDRVGARRGVRAHFVQNGWANRVPALGR